MYKRQHLIQVYAFTEMSQNVQFWEVMFIVKENHVLPGDLHTIKASNKNPSTFSTKYCLFILLREAYRTTPVSYTHLDVYKRQVKYLVDLLRLM